MRFAAALVLAMALPACASYVPSPYAPASLGPASLVPGSLDPVLLPPEGPSTTSKSGDADWYAGSPKGVKEFGRHGGYGAVGVTKGFEQFDTGGLPVETGDSDLGITLRGGYRTEEGLAFEGCIDSVTGYSIDAGGPTKADVDMASFSFRGKYYLGKQRVQPYAFVGVGYTWVSIDTPGFTNANGIFVGLGAGVDVYITLDVGVFLEGSYNRTTGDIKDLDHMDISGGMVFRF